MADPLRGLVVALGSLAGVGSAEARPGAGTLADPVRIDGFPFATRGATAGTGVIDRYACAAADESGPEVVYAFTLAAPARVSVWVSGLATGVDVDVHLLSSLALAGTTASACVARGDVSAEAVLGAGPHYLVVDSYAGAASAGGFVVHADAVGDAWSERPVAEGVTLRMRRFADLAGAEQVVGELVVDPSVPGVSVKALAATGCQTVGALGAARGAVAGVNGGYFSAGCAPVSLLKASGVLLGNNGASVARGAFGISAAGQPLVQTIAPGADWPVAFEAHGGGPVLVTGGVARAGAAAWATEGLSSASFLGANPRTVAATDAAGRILLLTVDGRRSSAAGLSLDGLAAFAAAPPIGAVDAVNLDGGGSTTLWVAGATPNGVLNYRSDAGASEDASHPGSRGVSGGFFVFAAPFNHPPRFQTAPVTAAAIAASYQYDADAIDLDVDDSVAFSLEAGPPGMAVESSTGVVSWTPPAGAPTMVDVALAASDGRGGRAVQRWSIVVAGGTDADADAGAAPDGGGDGGLEPGDEASCGCRAGGRTPGGGLAAALAVLLGLVLHRRRPAAVRPQK